MLRRLPQRGKLEVILQASAAALLWEFLLFTWSSRHLLSSAFALLLLLLDGPHAGTGAA
jgi:hypothetical protein